MSHPLIVPLDNAMIVGSDGGAAGHFGKHIGRDACIDFRGPGFEADVEVEGIGVVLQAGYVVTLLYWKLDDLSH
jgi:hypothetical protein